MEFGGLQVLQNVTFEASPGEFVAIVGKSGSGKTSFLYALAGLIPFSGQVIAPPNLGMVFQHYSLFPWLTAAQNIAFGLDRLSAADRRRVVVEHLKLAEIEDKKDHYPAQLSGGQAQRVALARSLAPGPEVLLMDEPYGALDVHTRDKMQQWLLNVWAAHKITVVFVTHSIEEAIFLADRVLVLDDTRFQSEIRVPFPRPRSETDKFLPQFTALRRRISEALTDQTGANMAHVAEMASIDGHELRIVP